MIERHRCPDGTNRDIDLGPGPVGLTPQVSGVSVAVIAVSDSASNWRRYQRDWKRRKVAK